MPIDHLTINVSPSDFSAAVSFYTAMLAPLDYTQVMSFEGLVGLGVCDTPDFWIAKSDMAATTRATHIAFSATSTYSCILAVYGSKPWAALIFNQRSQARTALP